MVMGHGLPKVELTAAERETPEARRRSSAAC